MRPHGRGRELAAIAAMITVVGLLAALLVKIAPGRSGQQPAIGTPTPTATATATATPNLSVPGHWTPLPGYQNSATRSLALAPSDPRTAYAYLAGVADSATPTTPSKFGPAPTLSLRQTRDGGTTWQALPLPIPQPQGATPDAYGIMGLLVSPADPQTVFLTIQLGTSALCQQYDSGGLGKSGGVCIAQFVSETGGQTWKRLHLPAVAPQENGMSELTGPLVAQGSRLYAGLSDFCQCSGAAPAIRIVKSDDGGVTWSTADDALAAQGLGVDGFAVAPAGDGVFAAVESVDPATLIRSSQEGPPYTPGDVQLWRSADAGAAWAKVEDVPHNFVSQMVAAAGPDAEHPVLYLLTDSDATGGTYTTLPDPILEASADGGKTWQTAPPVDLLGGARPQTSPLVAHPDGSVVLLVTQAQTNASALVSWRPGAKSWRQLTNPLAVGSVSALLIMPVTDTSSGSPDIYLLGDVGVQRFSVP